MKWEEFWSAFNDIVHILHFISDYGLTAFFWIIFIIVVFSLMKSSINRKREQSINRTITDKGLKRSLEIYEREMKDSKDERKK